ncbi:hypothetical protein B0H10DRAFT_2326956, partial [Mycena sp. CBHHK59/15]
SSCHEVYEFQIAAASKSTAAKPCTNVPLRCTLCPDTHWKYNMAAHLAGNHPGWELTATTETQEVLTAKIGLAPGEDSRLQEPIVVGRCTAEKRPAVSPAGTPRRHRIARTSCATASLDPNDLGGGDEDDADEDFIP